MTTLREYSVLLEKTSFDYDEVLQIPTQQENTQLRYKSFGQIIARARMEKKPLIIVEGIDDVKIYESFGKKVGKKISVRAIETFPGYDEGCDHVKKFIEDAQDTINEAQENERFILGIIDRDASYYRGERYDYLKSILVLNFYSYESHFVTKNNVRYILERILNSAFGINEEIIEYVYSGFQNVVEQLFYMSLEALKNACVREYQALVGYGMSYGQIRHMKEAILPQVLEKKEHLDAFSVEKGITPEDFKKVIKGKWLLESFLDSIHDKIQDLSNFCQKNQPVEGQQRCQFCEAGVHEKCLWKIKKYYTKNVLNNLVLEYTDFEETQYLLNRIEALG